MGIDIVDFDEEHYFWLLQSDVNGVGTRRWREILKEGKAYTALNDDASIAGLAVCHLTYEGCHLYWLFVFPEFRKQGVGAALLNKVLQSYRQEGCCARVRFFCTSRQIMTLQ
eukprot:GEMP01090240.1.p2 GENE.GEMP01090240.1~~GEMP01090240.1.p2  ORF type:complete len:112 (+),score=25.20 GEMP01090240.1:60-395(+)